MTDMDIYVDGPSEAVFVRIRGIVQGVGFRPFVYRLAHAHELRGWVLNAEEGVEIHAEGYPEALARFVDELKAHPPPASRIADLDIAPAEAGGFETFSIRESTRSGCPTVRIAPDLPVCDACLEELFDPDDRRYHYPYINCTNCGPRYSIIQALPYDRPQTTMQPWSMCQACAREYENPSDRRFHAQPIACPACGPQYLLRSSSRIVAADHSAVTAAAQMLRTGRILAVKGLGGYHLACDARNGAAVQALRDRKYRKEKPFAVMVRDPDTARSLAALTGTGEALLTSTARPIVLAPACTDANGRPTLPEGLAPDNRDLGILLPYTPLHHLLFNEGAPPALVMTSANRSNEPIAYRNDEAFERLGGIADAFLIGERPIARRVDDSVTRVGPFGPVILRRARGFAPRAVAHLHTSRPILGVGADLKNSVTLVINGQAFVSQHIGDLKQYGALQSFRETLSDLLRMYDVVEDELLVVHDRHPEYAASLHGQELSGSRLAVQHHRAHIASVLAEREAWNKRVVGFAFDGIGFGDDGTIWGGEVFVGGLTQGLHRAAHLHPAALPGGDAAARVPVQAAAGFLDQLTGLPDLTAPPFGFPDRYRMACNLVQKQVRTFPTTSMGRLFDTAAALLGFTREMTYEGQAAVWLEHQARAGQHVAPYPFPELDFRPLLRAVIDDRLRGRPVPAIARAFHRAVACSVVQMGSALCTAHSVDTLVLSGGVFQNQLLLQEIRVLLAGKNLSVWTNRAVPPNDGGISLGQAALGACRSAR